MTLRTHFPLLLLGAALLAGCSADPAPESTTEESTPADDPLAALDIATATAASASSLPLGTVAGVISLPPEARVAVSAPFPGVLTRLFVIEGQDVQRGQALAVVRAAEPVQFGGELARAQAELGLAQARANRLQQLADEGIIAAARADEAQAQVRIAQASVAENRRLIAMAGASADGTMTLRAPIAGRVQHVAVDTGGPVDTMTAPFLIENASAYRIDLQLPERLARQVRPGMAVEVSVPVAGGEPMLVSGTILSVAPSIDPATRSVLAKASIGTAPGLVPGQNVMVTINGASTDGGVWVPTVAVTRIGDQDHVFVRDGNSFVPRAVTVAAQAGGRTVLSAGLQPGEVVATSGITELKAMAAE